uniref:Uncharacterized protein n=1 Tax=Arundo donax TaxID=35708 RepID=A0A0A9DZB7_ARUDO
MKPRKLPSMLLDFFSGLVRIKDKTLKFTVGLIL